MSGWGILKAVSVPRASVLLLHNLVWPQVMAASPSSTSPCPPLSLIISIFFSFLLSPPLPSPLLLSYLSLSPPLHPYLPPSLPFFLSPSLTFSLLPLPPSLLPSFPPVLTPILLHLISATLIPPSHVLLSLPSYFLSFLLSHLFCSLSPPLLPFAPITSHSFTFTKKIWVMNTGVCRHFKIIFPVCFQEALHANGEHSTPMSCGKQKNLVSLAFDVRQYSYMFLIHSVS